MSRPPRSSDPARGTRPPRDDSGSFADLGVPQPLVEALARHGVTRPFAIQTAALPDALAGADVLGRAQTGSGKTLAFGLPILARLAGRRAAPHRPLALVLVPTRELAMQVNDALEPLAHALGLRLRVIMGGAPYAKQTRALSTGVELVVATPGRLDDLIDRGSVDLGSVEIVAVDEADHMTDLGFLPVVDAILGRTKPGGQRLLFSATLDGAVGRLVERHLVDPVQHSTAPAVASVDTMEHHVLLVRHEHKNDVTAAIAARDGRTLLFVRTQRGADRLATRLASVGVRAGSLHGGKTQAARSRALTAFRDGTVPVLVATDVAARGIHVDDVGLVVHVDPPSDPRDYLHRAGRTARAGDSGVVVTLATPNQQREVDAMTRRAGVDARRHRIGPGDARLTALTGARAPSGRPVEAPPADRPPARPGPRSSHRRTGAHGRPRRRAARP